MKQATSKSIRTSDAPKADTAYDLWADAERSARYHAERAGFFDAIHRTLNFIVFVTASSAAVSVATQWLSTPAYNAVFMLLPAVIAAIEAAFGISTKARLHDSLRQRLFALAGRIDRFEDSSHRIQEWHNELYAALADEPPTVYYALNAACYNAVAQVIGAPGVRYKKIPPWKLALRNIWPFHHADFPRMDRPSGS
ncbi:hypothetical protein [Thalassobaculum sp.]|uniref:hypothetical protein n=1 Tax=Thalassobaculum sp. TaxID=2022740 RepID=UPI0032EBC313